MNKQIEEMANIVHDADAKIIYDMVKPKPDEFVGRALPRQVYIAKALYKEGYRKSTDVAREIFGVTMQAIEIGVAKADAAVNASAKDPAFREVLKHTGEMYSGYIGKCICEAFKKYTESEGAK